MAGAFASARQRRGAEAYRRMVHCALAEPRTLRPRVAGATRGNAQKNIQISLNFLHNMLDIFLHAGIE